MRKEMTETQRLAPFDIVELIEPVDAAPQGARGGLIDELGGDNVIVEVMEPELDGLDRLVFARLDQLRLVKLNRSSNENGSAATS
jgi:hypothetical protein